MNKLVIFALFSICCVTSVSGCGKADSGSFADSDIKEAVAENNNFAFDLYGKLKNNDSNSNLFFSPYSISTALAMTYPGARGETEKQMASALHFTLPSLRLHKTFGELQKQLVQEEKSRGYQLLIANALWGQKGEPFLLEFLNLTQSYYGAGISQLDFVNETEKSRQIINRWVEEKTKEKIKDIIPGDGISPDTELILTNAIYFKGEWKTKFEEKDTEPADFAISEKEKIKVPFMHLKKDFKYYEDEKMQIVELPYKSDELSMLVLLPNETEGIKELENMLAAKSLNTLLSKTDPAEIDVYFPKFKITWGSFSLNKVLIDLGMPDAFDRRKADFSGINGIGGIWISSVFHQACIEVNEEGTEAAAGTGVVMTWGITDIPVFCADHPFIFIIKDNRTGSILFMGRVINPAE